MMLSYCHAWLSPAIIIIAIRDDHVASYNILSLAKPVPFSCESRAKVVLKAHFSKVKKRRQAKLRLINIGSYSNLTITQLFRNGNVVD